MKDKYGTKSLIVAATIVVFICITVVLQSCKPEAVVKEVVAPVKEEIKEVEEEIDNIVPGIKEELNKLDFGQAWRSMYNLYGEGHIFDWRDGLYTTNMREELITITKVQ